ncbi:MAG: hypothetical protein WDO06_04925 [Actinomycetota bacterium]
MPILSAVVIILLWQLFIFVTKIPNYKLPTPLQVFESLQKSFNQGILWGAVKVSVIRGATGFLFAIAIATPLGLLLGLNRNLRLLFRPILVGLQQLPSVAWVPAAVILVWTFTSDCLRGNYVGCCSIDCQRLDCRN